MFDFAIFSKPRWKKTPIYFIHLKLIILKRRPGITEESFLIKHFFRCSRSTCIGLLGDSYAVSEI